MKKTNLFAILTLATAPALLHAQTTNFSDIVGYQTSTIPVGRSMFSAPLILEEIAKGSVTSNTATQVDTGIGAITLSGSSQYYMEVISGAYEGDRIDLDVAATSTAQSGTPGRIVLKSASYNSNTLLGSELVGATVAIRKHLTLSALNGLISSGSFVASTSAANADQIQIFEGGGFSTYYYFSAAQGWYRQTPLGSAQNKVIPPGSAIMFTKKSAPVTLTSVGAVRTTKLQLPLSSGNQLVSMGTPVDSPLSSLTPNGSWSASTTAGNADQILVFNGTGFETYYYFSAAQGWYKQTPLGKSTNNVLNSGSGFFLRKKNSDVNYAISSPVINN